MRIFIFSISVLFSLQSRAQILTDEYSKERDIEFYKVNCDSNELTLKRVLKKGMGESNRNGREILVALNSHGNMIYEFEDIGAYSSLFFDSASFTMNDINSDSIPELIIEIEPFESANYIWVYELNPDCGFSFVSNLHVRDYKIQEGELVVNTMVVGGDWQDDVDSEYVLRQVEPTKLKKLDFYRLQNSKLINTNSEHRTEIQNLIKGYKEVLQQITEQESGETADTMDSEKYAYQAVKSQLKKAIENYGKDLN
ncbi:MAG: hypothetical protein HEP71_24815 [Roseivirga sp.]|nr:hypothetical protein [Roseivirga sp.]